MTCGLFQDLKKLGIVRALKDRQDDNLALYNLCLIQKLCEDLAKVITDLII